MYCSSCGTANTRGLNYCNRCGVTLSIAPFSRLAGLVWTIPLAMAVITLGGVGMVFLIGLELVRRGGEVSLLTALLLLFDVIVVVLIDWMLLRQLTRVIDIHSPVRGLTRQGAQELGGHLAPELDAPPMASTLITEQATRMFQASGRDANP